MENDEIMQEPMPEPTPEQREEWEAERKAHEEKTMGPYREAAKQRNQSAAIIAEHDELLADMLYEMTMNEIGGEEEQNDGV